MHPSPVVVVRRLPSGRWRWHFVDEGAGVGLASNHTFDDPDSAERSAMAAYPDLPIERAGAEQTGAETSQDEPASDRGKPRRRLRKFLGLGLILLVLLILLPTPHRSGREGGI